VRRLWPLLPFLVAGLLVSRCGDDAARVAAEDAAAADPWLQGRHDLTLVVVGDLKGKLKPCGCTKPQLGGLERLAALVDRLRPRSGGAVAGIGLGGFLSRTGLQRQQELKSSLVRAALEEMGFQALCLGVSDLYVPTMFQVFGNGRGLQGPRPPVNVVPAASSGIELPATSTAFAEFQLRTLPVRALTLVDPVEAERLQAEGIADGVITPATALQGLRAHPDTLWVIGSWVSGDAAVAMARAAAALGPAVIVDFTREAESRSSDRVPLGGKPLVVSFDEMGKEVGVLDLDLPTGGKGWLATWRAVPLGPDLDASPSDLRPRIAGLFDLYRQEVRADRVVDQVPRNEEGPAKYVGSASCAACHRGIYEDWLRTGHAQALHTLRKVDYHWDPECLVCHVQGPRRVDSGSGTQWIIDPSGWRDAEATPYLGAVGCENCHGPGSLHAAAPTDRSLFAPGGPNRRSPGRDDTCVKCHDADNSHGFLEEYETRLQRVNHSRVPSDRRTTWRPK
jgi:hypothetical protein